MNISSVVGEFRADMSTFDLQWQQDTQGEVIIRLDNVIHDQRVFNIGQNYIPITGIAPGSHEICVNSTEFRFPTLDCLVNPFSCTAGGMCITRTNQGVPSGGDTGGGYTGGGDTGGGYTGGGDTGGACPKGNSYPAPWDYPFETCAGGYTFDLDFSRKEVTLCRCNSITHEDLNKEKDTSIAKYLPYAIVGFLLIFLLRR